MRKEIKGFPGYSIERTNKSANVFGKRGKIKIFKSINGYCVVYLRNRNKSFCKQIHRLIWEAFRGPIGKNLQINHIDGDKENNAISNLEVVTPTENVEHAIRIGLCAKPKPITLRNIKTGKLRTLKSHGEAVKFLGISWQALSGLRFGYQNSRNGWAIHKTAPTQPSRKGEKDESNL